jgi:small subunit ribosomal protein S1
MSAENNTTAPSSVAELAPSMQVRGTIKRIELYGAFVDIGVGQDALLHVSQLGKPNVRNVEDVVKVGQQVDAYILRVDREANRIALSLVKPPAVDWDQLQEGQTVTGTVVRMEPFGVFVDIGAERPGMIHVSELASGYVNSPSDVVKVGQEVNAQIIKLNRKKKRIDMSLKALEEPVRMPVEPEDNEPLPTAMELALRRAMQGGAEDDEQPSRRQNQRTNAKGGKRREQLEDILQRTLRGHNS